MMKIDKKLFCRQNCIANTLASDLADFPKWVTYGIWMCSPFDVFFFSHVQFPLYVLPFHLEASTLSPAFVKFPCHTPFNLK